MEWSVGNSGSRYKVNFSEKEETLFLSKLIFEDEEINFDEISLSKDQQSGRIIVELDGVRSFAHVSRCDDEWWIHFQGRIYVINMYEPGSQDSSISEGSLSAPMPGTILDVMVKKGQRVREGQTLLVMEAMKMEHRIQAPRAGEVTSVYFQKGDRVDMGANLVEIGD
tara:strand:+ start:4055 stop:4555 length:501 start_codon:yes stop_codon:yes gene_type:complete